MVICPRCATRFKTNLSICHVCGAGPIASIQEDSDAQPEQPAPDFTPRISAGNIRSRFSQNALIWGVFSGVGLCLLIAGYTALFGEGLWFGCAIMVFVAPCAGLLGAFALSQLAESLQILIRPLLHALDPRARNALRKIKEESEEESVTDDAFPQSEASEAVFNPQIQRECDGDGAERD